MAKIISIDGLDGSGKGTQAEFLHKHFLQKGRNAHLLSFPVYENISSTFVRFYLDGKLGGNPSDTNAYAASSFYAIDRYISYRTDWQKLCTEDAIIIFNRYTTANAVHQLSKIDKSHWDSFLDWLWDYEFEKLGLPVPDKIFYLVVPPKTSLSLVESRSISTGRKKDIHELDHSHMQASYEAGLYAARKLGWTMIECCDISGKMRSIEEIQSALRVFLDDI